MDLREVVILAAGLGFSGVFYASAELAAAFFRRAELRRAVRMTAVFPLVFAVMTVVALRLTEAQESAPVLLELQGPVTGQGAVQSTAVFPVDYGGAPRQLRIGFAAAPWQTIQNPLPLKLEIVSPDGEVILAVQRSETVEAGGVPQEVREEFTPKEAGQHTLRMELPQGIHLAKAEIR